MDKFKFEREEKQEEVKNECRKCGQKKAYNLNQGWCLVCMPDNLAQNDSRLTFFKEERGKFGPLNTREKLLDFWKLLGVINVYGRLVQTGNRGMNIVEVQDCKERTDPYEYPQENNHN